MSRCFFHDFAPEGLRRCDGNLQWHHAVKQQTVKRLFPRLPIYAMDEELG